MFTPMIQLYHLLTRFAAFFCNNVNQVILDCRGDRSTKMRCRKQSIKTSFSTVMRPTFEDRNEFAIFIPLGLSINGVLTKL